MRLLLSRLALLCWVLATPGEAASMALQQATPSSVTGTCSATQHTLSMSCDGLCGEFQPCIAYDANSSATTDCPTCIDDASGACSYQCFAPEYEYNDFNAYFFFITFGSYESDAEKSERADDPTFDDRVAGMEDYAQYFPNASNDELTAIDTLDISRNTSNVYLCGGPDCFEVVRGKMVLLELADDLLAAESHVTWIYLSSINLLGMTGALPTMLPKAIMILLLINCWVTEFPTNLGGFTALYSISLSENYIRTIESTGDLDNLRALEVQHNNLNTFEAHFPQLLYLNLSRNELETIPDSALALKQLTILDLSDNLLSQLNGSFPNVNTLNLSYNAFTAIPDVVFELTELQYFYFAGNVLESLSFTAEQVAFLQRLNDSDVQFWTSNADETCVNGEYTQIKQLTVCQISGSTPSPTPTPTPKSTPDTALIVGIVAGTVVVLLALAFAFWGWRKRLQASKNADPSAPYVDSENCQVAGNQRVYSVTTALSTGPVIRHGSSSARESRSSQGQGHALWDDEALLALQVRSEDVRDVRCIGAGAFGVVWLVQFRDTQFLASKRLRLEAQTRARTAEFVREIKLVAGFSHPNVVAFVGVAWRSERDLQALFEFAEHGDLRSFLAEPSMIRSWTPTKFQLAVDMAEALVYVHSFAPPLVHRDLKTRNVLVSGELRAKLTDFGVSRCASRDATMTMGVGTSRWLAPEVIAGTTDYAQPSDVFALGVVLSELDTHALPYDDAVGANGQPLEEIAVLQRVAAGTLRPTFSAGCPAAVLDLAMRCLALDPSSRPTAPEVSFALRTAQQQYGARPVW